MQYKEKEKLIARYLAGEATTSEQSEFRLWLNDSSQNKEQFRQIALTYQLSKGESINSRKSAVLSKVRKRIEVEGQKTNNYSDQRQNIYLKTWVSAAAVIVFIISVGLVYFTDVFQSDTLQESSTLSVIKSNPAGQKSKVFLPDGSIVWLNSESSISYESEFNSNYRHIQLKGEAFFEVKKDTNKPFVVFSGDISTTALGTAFNVNAFDENNITVSLTTGKVSVETINMSDANRGLIIDAGEGVVFNPSSENPIDKITIDPEKVKLWRNGSLLLNNATLGQTIRELERWYGVKITLKNNPTKSWSANGLFDNEYLENVLTALSFSQDFEYKINGKQVYVIFKQNMPM